MQDLHIIIVLDSCLCLRSLSATVSAEEESDVNVMSVEEMEKMTDEEGVKKEEEEVVMVDEIGEMELPCLDHLLTWAATASPSDRLRLMNNVAEVQAKLFDIHMK